jgi:DNA repair exonuclease SbcCD ATPase subunit
MKSNVATKETRAAYAEALSAFEAADAALNKLLARHRELGTQESGLRSKLQALESRKAEALATLAIDGTQEAAATVDKLKAEIAADQDQLSDLGQMREAVLAAVDPARQEAGQAHAALKLAWGRVWREVEAYHIQRAIKAAKADLLEAYAANRCLPQSWGVFRDYARKVFEDLSREADQAESSANLPTRLPMEPESIKKANHLLPREQKAHHPEPRVIHSPAVKGPQITIASAADAA